ncbi:39S ribosomal protein L17, mitochondrial [Condylostylus longicornis]|uniref:39S ribosomal protein L17, mitochondrial n=1 Tax=Condylostylus longicornis TaxID=2530218 RepID=UPI00244DE86B|nr:39S ribosomal protein L17, mitochondrial [Condylostylus longicornis]
MNQADVTKLVSQLKIAVRSRQRNLKNKDGPEGRLNKLRKTVTALIKHERIELNYNRADEARGYAERLISDAIRYGENHRPTVEIADYWLTEKPLMYKLFRVLVPRFENCNTSFTKIYRAPREYQERGYSRSVLELRGNPYPSLLPDYSLNRNLLHNVLLDEAKKEFNKEKLQALQTQLENSTTATKATTTEETKQEKETK